MTKKSCDDAISTIYPYLDGEMTVMRRMFVRLHLRRCSGCVGAFAFEQRLKMVIRERCQEEVPKEMIESLRSIIETERNS